LAAALHAHAMQERKSGHCASRSETAAAPHLICPNFFEKGE